MAAAFHHVNIVSHDPHRLAQFYIDVFGCVLDGPQRNLSGDWIERGTGLPGARITGLMLRLPNADGTHGDLTRPGPRLEIFHVAGLQPPGRGEVTRPGLMHLCFEVDSAHETLERMLAAGGSPQGEIVDSGTIPGVGRADFCYARDPDGNIVELISWSR